MESSDEDVILRKKLAADLTNAMVCVGIPMDHILRKKLDKFGTLVGFSYIKRVVLIHFHSFSTDFDRRQTEGQMTDRLVCLLTFLVPIPLSMLRLYHDRLTQGH